MFRNVFLKTVHEKRWMILFWGLGVAAMALLMMGFYPSFKSSDFDQLLESLPKAFQGMVGDISSLKTVPGYISQQVFALRIPLLTLIMSVTLFTGLLAGDEGEGTLQTLLAQPVTRLRVLLEKYLAGLVISLLVCSGVIVGVTLGLLMINEQLSFLRLMQATIGVWLLTVLFGTIGFAIGAITGKRSVAGSVTGLLTFVTYLITSFVTSVSGLATIERFSPFHYYNSPSIAEFGLDGRNFMVMVGTIIVLLTISSIIFMRRDIYQR